MDAFILKKASVDMERTRIRTAVKLIQRHPRFHNVPIVHIPENAPGSAGPHLHEHLRDMPNILTMEEYGTKKSDGGTLGVPATDRNVQTYQMSMMLSTRAIHYSENCMTYPGQDMSKIKDKFEFQLLCWERVVEYDPAKPLSNVREKWTGKAGAGNDDLAICGLMLCEWPARFFESPKYSDFIRRFVNSAHKRQQNSDMQAVSLPREKRQRSTEIVQTPYSRSKAPRDQSVPSPRGGRQQQMPVATPSYQPHSIKVTSAKRGSPSTFTGGTTTIGSIGQLGSALGRPFKVPRVTVAK